SNFDCGFWISDLLYRYALSVFIKLIRQRRTLNPKSKIPYPKSIRNKSVIICQKKHYGKTHDFHYPRLNPEPP
ncbi:MAG: hypothetical protein PVF32_15650, partial [Desulfobacterales bacterium]